MSIADSTAIFGMNVPSPNLEALAGAQGAAQQLPAEAGRLRHAAQGAASLNIAQAAGKIANLADAAASGDTPNAQTAANGAADFVQGHPEMFGSLASEVIGLARNTIAKWETAASLIDQANDPASTAAAIDATADALGQTAVMISVIAGALAGFGVGAAIGAIAGLLVALAKAVASLIRKADDPAPASTQSSAPTASDENDDPDNDTDNDGNTSQATEQTSTGQTTDTSQTTDTGQTTQTGNPGPGGSDSGRTVLLPGELAAPDGVHGPLQKKDPPPFNQKEVPTPRPGPVAPRYIGQA